MNTAPRVKFLRKALFPKSIESLNSLIKGVEILIASPLKLSQMTEKFPDMLSDLRFMVLDEADKMFEMGFLEQIDGILSKVKSSENIRKLLFSATMQPQI